MAVVKANSVAVVGSIETVSISGGAAVAGGALVGGVVGAGLTLAVVKYAG